MPVFTAALSLRLGSPVMGCETSCEPGESEEITTTRCQDNTREKYQAAREELKMESFMSLVPRCVAEQAGWKEGRE